jgi:carbon monoxide dehydrogenase subunit G
MITVSTTATADIPIDPEQVWRLMSDIPSYTEWVEGTVEVTGGPTTASLGAIYHERNRVGPFVSSSTWTVEVFDAAVGRQRHACAGSGGIRRFVIDVLIEPRADGSHLALTLQADVAAGPLTRPFAALLRRALTSSNAKSVAAFAALAQRSAELPAAVAPPTHA